MNSSVYVDGNEVDLRAFQAVLDTGSSVITASTADSNTINAVRLTVEALPAHKLHHTVDLTQPFGLHLRLSLFPLYSDVPSLCPSFSTHSLSPYVNGLHPCSLYYQALFS